MLAEFYTHFFFCFFLAKLFSQNRFKISEHPKKLLLTLNPKKMQDLDQEQNQPAQPDPEADADNSTNYNPDSDEPIENRIQSYTTFLKQETLKKLSES